MSQIPEKVSKDLHGKTVLVIWGPGNATEDLQSLANDLRSLHKCSNVTMEHAERLTACIHPFIINCFIFKSAF